MEEIEKGLGPVVQNLSDQNYEQSFAFYRFWFDIGHTYTEISSDQTFTAIWNNRMPATMNPDGAKIIHPTAHLILRFVGDAESDHILAPYNAGLQNRLCARILREFFERNMAIVRYIGLGYNWEVAGFHFAADTNLVAHWANLGYVEEDAIRNRILQSLISHPYLHDHQADALIVLFKLAGATFEVYVDSSVVDRCFELLKSHYVGRDSVKHQLVQVRAPRAAKGGHRVNENFQEVVALRERDWEGLPPPPIVTASKAMRSGVTKGDPAATPVVASLGLPSRDLEPRIPQFPPLEPIITSEPDTVLTSSVTQSPSISTIPASPITQSPSVSIATLSDFTITDTSDDESPTDPTVTTPHDTFYLEEGNVEVLCGNTLFRVHTSILSFHSPALRRMFAPATVATAESPNGCPRILSTDTARDFAALLKMIYLPGYVPLPRYR